MEQNEENTNYTHQQELFFKYFIQSIEKQQQQQRQQVKPIDFSIKIKKQSSLSIPNKPDQLTQSYKTFPFDSSLSIDKHTNLNEDILKQFCKHLQQAQEHYINRNQRIQTVSSSSTNSILSKKCYQSNGSPTHSDHDNDYWERRRKNNEAAKRSRDARRVKEDEIALR